MVSVVSVTGAMEDRTITLGEDKNIFLHGVWVAGLKISDRLVNSIASDFLHKPSRRCTLTLSRVGLDFLVLPVQPNLHHQAHALDQASITSDIKHGRSQHISFPFLRDFSINPHNQHCLMVIFIDSKNRFSILVFSCQNPRTLWQLTKDYQELKNRKLTDQSSPATRGANGSAVIITSGANLQQQDDNEDTPVEQVITVNGVSPKPKPPGAKIHLHSQNGNAYTSIDIPKTEQNGAPQEVTIVSDSEVAREVANSGADGSVQTFHVSTQVLNERSGSDTESGSMTRSVSWSQEVDDNVFETEGESTPKSTSVSATAYHNNRNVVKSGATTISVSNGHGPKQNGDMPNGSAYGLRNVGTQTEPETPTPQRTRYTKKVLKPTLSNQYKEKVAAVRKKTGSASTSSATPSATISIMSTEPQGELLRANSGKSTLVLDTATPVLDAPIAVQQPPPPIRPRLSTSRSTISKPIETVYTRRKKFQHPHQVDEIDAGDKEPQGRGHFAGPKRVVVLPNNQAVVLSPGPPRDGNSIYQTFQYVQNPYVNAHPRLRTSSTSSNASSRNGSLRVQRDGRPGQAPPRPISYPPPPR